MRCANRLRERLFLQLRGASRARRNVGSQIRPALHDLSIAGGESARRDQSDSGICVRHPRVKLPAPPRAIRVLYVDNSLGFGGAVKSLSLTLTALPSIEKFVLTSQDSDIVRMWFAGHRVLRFRRVFNYRNKDRVLAGITSRPLKWAARKGFALADLMETGRNSIRIAWIIRKNRIDLIHLNNGFVPREALGGAAL